MRKFVLGPSPDYKMVNLENVSNIAFEEYYNRNNELVYKIIFNFDYGVSLKSDYNKIIADYVYFIYSDKDEYTEMVEELSKLINEKMWIAPLIDGYVNRIANPDKISFVAIDERKNRIILNLNTSVSFYSNKDRKTSDFLYFDFKSHDEYKSNLKYIQDQLSMEF